MEVMLQVILVTEALLKAVTRASILFLPAYIIFKGH
jgi:hypothetical protein